MSEKDSPSVDGMPNDGVGHDLISPERLAQHQEAIDALSRLRAPLLVRVDNPHEKLYFAAFDGTGNNKFKDPEHATNVARIYDQIKALNPKGTGQIYANYLVGPGTQDSRLAATWDLARGFTYESNINEMYEDLVERVDQWKRADPDAVIRVQSIGFSRGASQAAGFTRLVHERGIPDLDSRIINAEGRIHFTRYHVAPGEVVQSVGLFDPVATGVPMAFDRRLPPSVVSGFQITAADEKRATFPSDRIIPPGLSEDGRFLNVMMPGAHSNIGGSYLRNGLSVRAGNLMIDYCNATCDPPLLRKRFESDDPRLTVIHRSTEGMDIYRLDPRESIRGEPSGSNFRLAPPHVEGAGPVPHGPESPDPELVRTLSYRPVSIGQTPTVPEAPVPPMADLKALVEAGRSMPFAPRVVGALGVVSMARDAGETFKRSSELWHQGNVTGAQSDMLHFGHRTLGMVAGAELGAAAAGVTGLETGPGALLAGAGGAVLGAVAGDSLADAIDSEQINQQTDSHGRTWSYDPGKPDDGWTRTVVDTFAERGLSRTQTERAPAALVDQLNYQASTRAAELRIAQPGRMADPYRQPSSLSDQERLGASHWERDAQSHAWTRTVLAGRVARHETAGPQQAAELDRAAEATIKRNLKHSPQGIAATYQAFYQHYRWARLGPMPEAVTGALRNMDRTALASDGHRYTRNPDGQWATPGTLWGSNTAAGNIKTELDATYQYEHPAPNLAGHTGQPAPAPGLDDPMHPGHQLFKQAQRQVHALDARLGRTPDARSDNLAGAAAVVALSRGIKRIDAVLPDTRDGSIMFVAQHSSPLKRVAEMPTVPAMNTPLQQSSANYLQMLQQQGQRQAPTSPPGMEQAQAQPQPRMRM